jgi:hypothetical protein
MKKVISLSLCMLLAASSLQAGFLSTSAPVAQEVAKQDTPYGKYALYGLGIGAAAFFTYCVYKAWCEKPVSRVKAPRKYADQDVFVIHNAQPEQEVRQEASVPVQVQAPQTPVAPEITYLILVDAEEQSKVIDELQPLLNALYCMAKDGKSTSEICSAIHKIKAKNILTIASMEYVVAYEDAIKERDFAQAESIYNKFMVNGLGKPVLNEQSAKETMVAMRAAKSNQPRIVLPIKK